MMEFELDLQLFAEEKTEKATPKRRQEARKKGHVFWSRELVSSMVLFSTFLAIRFSWNYIFMYFRDIFTYIIREYSYKDLNDLHNLYNLSLNSIELFFILVLPIISITFIVGIIMNLLQVGFVFSSKPLEFNLNKLNPVEGFKRIFSKRSMVELLKSLIKIMVVLYILYSILSSELKNIPQLLDMDIKALSSYIGLFITGIGIKVSLIFIGLGILDYIYQWWDFEKSIKMSRQEIKDELKETEGNPQIKAKIKEKQRRLSLRRMIFEVPKADVVITNPTHYAVALLYDRETMNAPKVVAKGKDFIALKIIEVAKENKVMIVENKVLAQTLYKTVDIDEEIPYDLYQVVAEILAYVYSIKYGKRGA